MSRSKNNTLLFIISEKNLNTLLGEVKNLVSAGGEKPHTSFQEIKEPEDDLISSSISLGSIRQVKNLAHFSGMINRNGGTDNIQKMTGTLDLKNKQGSYTII